MGLIAVYNSSENRIYSQEYRQNSSNRVFAWYTHTHTQTHLLHYNVECAVWILLLLL